MKKKIFSMVGVTVFAVALAFNINASMSNNVKMDVNLASTEVLTRGECDSDFFNIGRCSAAHYCYIDAETWECNPK